MRLRQGWGTRPVLGQDDVLGLRRDLVNRRDDCVSVRDGQLPAGTEVVLNIDRQEYVLGSDLHRCLRFNFLR
jgi:hypothetical protein